MIVHPNFLDHWKTRLLIELTGDKSAPIAVLRLWGHCQSSKRSVFPEMTPAQLASICFWEDRKPACQVALVKAGFVDKLTPKGFAAHQWDDHNSKLFANWENGLLGGRPPKAKKTNETDETQKPMGSVGLTQPEPIREDQTRPDLDKKSPDQTRPAASPLSASGVSGSGMDSFNSKTGVGGMGLDGIGLLLNKVIPFTTPTLEQVENCMRMHFAGAERYAGAFIKSMEKQSWRDNQNAPITCWQSVAKAYASRCALNQTQKPQRIDRSIGTTNEGLSSQYAGMGRLVKNKDKQ